MLLAAQLALAASEDPTVLLQDHGAWQLDTMMRDTDGSILTEEARQWAGLYNFADAAMHYQNQAPAFLKLLKTATKKDKKGQEYLELKPLVTMVMDVGRTVAKAGNAAMLPKVHAAVMMTEQKTEEMTLATEQLFSDIFLTKGEATEIMDYSLAIRARETAQAVQKMLVDFLPAFMGVANGADAVLNVAQFAAGMNGASPRSLYTVKTVHQQLTRMEDAVKKYSGAFHEKVDEVSRSTIKEGAQYTRKAGLKLKAKAIKHILSKVDKYEQFLGETQDEMTKEWLKVGEAFDQFMPDVPMKQNFKQVWSSLVLGVDGAFQNLFLGVLGKFKEELAARSKTIK